MDGRINLAAVNIPAYAPALGITGHDFLLLVLCGFFLFPVYFGVVLLWSLPGLGVCILVMIPVYLFVIFLLRAETKKKPRKGIVYEKIAAILTPRKYNR